MDDCGPEISHDNEVVAILHTLKNDLIDQVFGAFTDEEAFADWAEDFLKRNPSVDLYFTVLPCNPAPGEGAAASNKRNVPIPNPYRKSIFDQAAEDLRRLVG